MGIKSTPEYYCSCTPVNFYYVNVSFVWRTDRYHDFFSEMFYYLQGIILNPKTLYDAGSEIMFVEIETIRRTKCSAVPSVLLNMNHLGSHQLELIL